MVVFDQENDKERTTEFYTGESGVERVINELHDVPATVDVDANYVISVLFDNGRATTIVVYDGVPDGDDGMWTESNMVETEDGTVRLYGLTRTTGLNADAEAIGYLPYTGQTDYSFYVENPDGTDVGAGVDVKYTLAIYNNGKYIQDVTKQDTTKANGLIDDTLDLAKNSEDLEIRITDVVRVDTVDPDEGMVTLSFDTNEYEGAEFYYGDQRLPVTEGGRNQSSVQAPAGETITVWYGGMTPVPTLTNSFEIIAGGVVATNNAAAQEFTFTAPATNATLKALTTPVGYYAIEAGRGITMVNKATGEPVENGGIVADNTVLTVTSSTGNYTAKAGTTVGFADTTAYASGTDVTVNSDMRIHAVVEVTTMSEVTLTYEGTDGNTYSAGSYSGNRWVAVDTKLTVGNTVTGAGVYDNTNGESFGEDLTGTYTVGTEKVSLMSGWLVTLGDSVTAGANDEYSAGDVLAVKASTAYSALNLGTEDGAPANVVEASADDIYAQASADTASGNVDGAVTLIAMVEVTVPSADDAVEYMVNGIGMPLTHTGVNTFFVKAGTTLVVTLDTGSVTSVTSVDNDVTVPTGGISGARAMFTVGTSDVTVND